VQETKQGGGRVPQPAASTKAAQEQDFLKAESTSTRAPEAAHIAVVESVLKSEEAPEEKKAAALKLGSPAASKTGSFLFAPVFEETPRAEQASQAEVALVPSYAKASSSETVEAAVQMAREAELARTTAAAVIPSSAAAATGQAAPKPGELAFAPDVEDVPRTEEASQAEVARATWSWKTSDTATVAAPALKALEPEVARLAPLRATLSGWDSETRYDCAVDDHLVEAQWPVEQLQWCCQNNFLESTGSCTDVLMGLAPLSESEGRVPFRPVDPAVYKMGPGFLQEYA